MDLKTLSVRLEALELQVLLNNNVQLKQGEITFRIWLMRKFHYRAAAADGFRANLLTLTSSSFSWPTLHCVGSRPPRPEPLSGIKWVLPRGLIGHVVVGHGASAMTIVHADDYNGVVAGSQNVSDLPHHKRLHLTEADVRKLSECYGSAIAHKLPAREGGDPAALGIGSISADTAPDRPMTADEIGAIGRLLRKEALWLGPRIFRSPLFTA